DVPPDDAPARSEVNPPPLPHINLRELATPGRILAGEDLRSRRATVYSQGYARRHRSRLNGERLALQIFKPNVLNVKGTGFFMLDPRGVIYPLPVTPDKLKRLSIRAEVRMLGQRIRLREQRRKIALLNKDYAERLRQRKEARLKRSARKRRLPEFFSDSSLKPEDVVVTEQGLFVFRGTQNFPYSARDFVPLTQWRASKSRDRRAGNRLNALQRELRRRH
ncbi:MAG: hypothetical protein KDJ29_01560, partial [Hyphomicrobiales bacterium]|nr:hypothetical protein [Hyphomicrobiales bacterium]